MKKTAASFLVGGLMAAAVLGVTLGASSPVSAAAAPEAEPSACMSQDQQQNSAMMQSSDMQKKCAEMMKNMDMKTVMDQPKMQEKMTQMTPGSNCCENMNPGANKDAATSENTHNRHQAHPIT